MDSNITVSTRRGAFSIKPLSEYTIRYIASLSHGERLSLCKKLAIPLDDGRGAMVELFQSFSKKMDNIERLMVFHRAFDQYVYALLEDGDERAELMSKADRFGIPSSVDVFMLIRVMIFSVSMVKGTGQTSIASIFEDDLGEPGENLPPPFAPSLLKGDSI